MRLTTLRTPCMGEQAAPGEGRTHHSSTSYSFPSSSLTFPWATNSRWAAEAAFTRALVAAAMDLAASRICSSKFRLSSACCGQKQGVSPRQVCWGEQADGCRGLRGHI